MVKYYQPTAIEIASLKAIMTDAEVVEIALEVRDATELLVGLQLAASHPEIEPHLIMSWCNFGNEIIDKIETLHFDVRPFFEMRWQNLNAVKLNQATLDMLYRLSLDAHEIVINPTYADAYYAVLGLQLATRHPGVADNNISALNQLATKIIKAVVARHPDVEKILYLGFDESYDK